MSEDAKIAAVALKEIILSRREFGDDEVSVPWRTLEVLVRHVLPSPIAYDEASKALADRHDRAVSCLRRIHAMIDEEATGNAPTHVLAAMHGRCCLIFQQDLEAVSYTHLTLPTNREV